MPTGLLVPQGTDSNLVRLGVRTEDLGYDGVWLGELWGDNSIVVLIDNAIDHRRNTETGAAFIGIMISSHYNLLVGKFQQRVSGRKNESADAYVAVLAAVVFVAGWFGSDRLDR